MILGLDVGGTTSRCLLADRGGNQLGYGSAGGGNPVSRDAPEALAQVATAAREALQGRDPATVEYVLIGVAGLKDVSASAHAMRDVFRHLGVECPIDWVSDTEVAFAAGCSTGSGTVLVAGTGAVAADISRYCEQQSADGHGWLLGDYGSGFWIGREAVRLALQVCDGGQHSPFVDRVLQHYAAGGRHNLIAAVHGQIPVRLSEVAPVVFAMADNGDSQALRIIERAAECLVSTLQVVRPDGDERPIVVAGAVATHPRMFALIEAWSQQRWPQAEVLRTGDGSGGAIWLALHRLRAHALPEVHHRLTRPGRPLSSVAGRPEPT